MSTGMIAFVLAVIAVQHTEDLLVAPLLVVHHHHAHHPNPQVYTGVGRLAQQHQCVERIVVVGERLREEPVLHRVDGGLEQMPIQPHLAGVMVDLVFVA